MTDDEIISEVREIAAAMAIPRVHPGRVSGSLKYRVMDLLVRCEWPSKEHRQYLTKPGEAKTNGKPVMMQVLKAVVDDLTGELQREICERLLVAQWETLAAGPVDSLFRKWTPERAEQAIIEAASVLLKLCDQLEAKQSTNSSHLNWPTIAKVAKGLDENRGTVSRMLDNGKLRDNGMKNSARRIDPASVLEYCEANGVTYNDT